MAGDPIQVPLTNGVMWSFAHVTMQIAGLEFTGGFKSIKRSRKRNRTMEYSNHPDPVGKTAGQNEYQCSAEIFLEWYRKLQSTIIQQYGDGYGDRPFTIFIAYNAPGFGPMRDVVQNCTFDTTDADDSVGTNGLTRTVEFNPTKILFNGVDDCADPLAPV